METASRVRGERVVFSATALSMVGIFVYPKYNVLHVTCWGYFRVICGAWVSSVGSVDIPG